MSHTSPEAPKNSRPSRRRVFLYARVSSVAQSHGPSIEEQFIAMSKFAKRNKMDIVGYDMDDRSAHGPRSESRPGFQQALREAQRLDEAILVFNVSRLTRWLPTVELIRSRRIRVYSVDIGYVKRERLRSEVAMAQAESDHKSQARKALKAIGDLRRKPRTTLTDDLRRTGITNNVLRSDDNIRAAARHLATVPGVEHMTHQQRVDVLAAAGILRLKNSKTFKTGQWTREALRKRWVEIEDEMTLLLEDDLPGSPLP